MTSIIISFIFSAISLFENKCEINVPTYFDTTRGEEIKIESIGVKSYDLKIYDKWNKDINEINILNDGVYYYQIDYICNDGTALTKEGDIKLIKTNRR